MNTLEMIPADVFCRHHRIEISFIDALHEAGLIEVVYAEEQLFVPAEQLVHLEKLVRLHYQLSINLEGLETVSHLLEKINDMQQQILKLNNRLSRYEDV